MNLQYSTLTLEDIAIEAKSLELSLYLSQMGMSLKSLVDMPNIIDGANIDLKSFNAEYYRRELGADLNRVLETIKLFKEVGIWIEITTLIVPTKNDSDRELREIAKFIVDELGRDVPWHISAFSPNYKQKSLPRTSLESLERHIG